VILGTSAVVNSSSDQLPSTDKLDAMRLNWGPYLWMRCYMNGAGFVNRIVGPSPNWAELEAQAKTIAPGCDGYSISPFLSPEPSLGMMSKHFMWSPKLPRESGKRFRAALEALAYLIALGVRQHEEAGQNTSRITLSGGLARSPLMCEILASVLQRRLELLVSDEGPALGAAVTALAALENRGRASAQEAEVYPIAAAVDTMVKYRAAMEPNPNWTKAYSDGLKQFKKGIAKWRKR